MAMGQYSLTVSIQEKLEANEQNNHDDTGKATTEAKRHVMLPCSESMQRGHAGKIDIFGDYE